MKFLHILSFICLTLVFSSSLAKAADEFGDEFNNDEFGDNEDTNHINNEVNDPLEPLNRGIFYTYKFIYDYAGVYVIRGYTKVPVYIRNRLSSFVSNLGEPSNIVNHFAQGKFNAGFESMFRFIFNSTLGILGFIDIMGATGLQKKPNDLGATLAFYGVGEGPYMMILGPSTLRDTTGTAVNMFTNGVMYGDIKQLQLYKRSYYTLRYDTIVFLLDTGMVIRENEQMIRNSIDEYAYVRSVFLDLRRYKLKELEKVN